ncbi:MAG: hypothetical protein AAB224_09035 [Gemmatimonadota bacterium]
MGEAFAVVDAYQQRRPADPVALYQVGRLAAVSGQQLDRGEVALKKYLAVALPPFPNPAPFGWRRARRHGIMHSWKLNRLPHPSVRSSAP